MAGSEELVQPATIEVGSESSESSERTPELVLFLLTTRYSLLTIQ